MRQVAITFQPLGYSVFVEMTEQTQINRLISILNIIGIPPDIQLLDMNGIQMIGSIGDYPGHTILTILDDRITHDVYERTRLRSYRQPTIPRIQFPEVGQEKLDPSLYDRFIEEFEELKELKERASSRGLMDCMFPIRRKERMPISILDQNVTQADIPAIKRAYSLLKPVTVCNRISSYFTKPKNEFE
jgi:hypothetical protein